MYRWGSPLLGGAPEQGATKPERQDGGVGGTGCKAPKMNPALQLGSQQCALPRKRRKADPSGVRQARHLDQTPDGYWYFPLREVPPAVLLAQFRLILPEATAMGVRLSHASHGARSARTGGRLSNTSVTYPREGDNPGKLGLIPHRPEVLEGPQAERGSARPRMGRRPIR